MPNMPLLPSDIDVQVVISKLDLYCRASDWAGYDPYDALNSPLFRIVRLLDHRIPRLILTQALKRSPINFRPFLHITKTQNPKALALFLSAYLTLERIGAGRYQPDIAHMIERLRDLRSRGMDYWCWGYSFPWQTRSKVVPAGAPNLVCTVFVAEALLDAFDSCGDQAYLQIALSAADYILNDLYWTEGKVSGFSYPLPSLRSQVHNANFLAAALLCRAYRYTENEKFLEPALRVARYSAAQQRPDGSWHYGESDTQQWIDNFHTGYNLCALHAIGRYAETTEFDEVVRRGFEFYRSRFFQEDSSVKYFHHRKYPIDIHCVAQSIITLLTLTHVDSGNIPLAWAVLEWALAHMWDDRGFFWYRVLRFGKNRLSYMRWSQAWMFLAIAKLLYVSKGGVMDAPQRHWWATL